MLHSPCHALQPLEASLKEHAACVRALGAAVARALAEHSSLQDLENLGAAVTALEQQR